MPAGRVAPGREGVAREMAARVPVRWRVLGDVTVEAEPRPGLSPRATHALALLLRRPSRAVRAEELGGTAPDGTATVAAGRMAVSRLRQALRPCGLDAHVDTVPSGYALAVDPASVDHVAFTSGVRRAAAIEWPDEALSELEDALALWRGAPFGALGDERPFDGDAAALTATHRLAVEQWGDLVLRTGRHRTALDALAAAARDEPLRERRWVQLALAHYRTGNQAAALAVLRDARRTLADEVGIDPGPELRDLERRVLAQDPALGWRPERRRTRAPGLRAMTRPSVLLGRDRELADLAGLLDRHRVVCLLGLGGMGKTTLAAEVAERAERTVWVALLATTSDRSGVLRALADAVGLGERDGRRATDAPGSAAGPTPRDAEAVLLDDLGEAMARVGGLLVIDNAEHVAGVLAPLCEELVRRAPRARLLVTSRVPLAVAGAVTYTLGPLEEGSPEEPGPAALVAADFAGVPPSGIAERWTLVHEVCVRAGGVPLALELLGSAAAAGTLAAADPARAVDDAVAVAAAALPAESHATLELLAAIPADVSVELLALVAGTGADEQRRAAGHVVRAGLAIQRLHGERTGIHLLQPVRDALAVPGRRVAAVRAALLAAVTAEARRARPDLAGPVAVGPAALLDDEHDAVRWCLDGADLDGRLDAVLAMVPVWRATGRTVEGAAWLDRAAPAVALRGDDDLRAAFVVARVEVSPSMADRVPAVADLRWARDRALAAGDRALALRAGGELAVGLGWSGDLAGARAVLDDLEAEMPPDEPWLETALASLRALLRGASGDPRGAAVELRGLAARRAGVGTSGDVLSWLFLAMTMARTAGDDALVEAVLADAAEVPRDRFSGYPAAALLFERAVRARRRGDPEAGRLLWEAYGRLRHFGEHRTRAVCQRELGAWRLAQGDAAGIADLAEAARTLLVHDPPAASIALLHLATALGDRGEPSAGLVAAAHAARDGASGVPLDPEEAALLASHPPSAAVAAPGSLEDRLADLVARFAP